MTRICYMVVCFCYLISHIFISPYSHILKFSYVIVVLATSVQDLEAVLNMQERHSKLRGPGGADPTGQLLPYANGSTVGLACTEA